MVTGLEPVTTSVAVHTSNALVAFSNCDELANNHIKDYYLWTISHCVEPRCAGSNTL